MIYQMKNITFNFFRELDQKIVIILLKICSWRRTNAFFLAPLFQM